MCLLYQCVCLSKGRKKRNCNFQTYMIRHMQVTSNISEFQSNNYILQYNYIEYEFLFLGTFAFYTEEKYICTVLRYTFSPSSSLEGV